MGRFAHAGKESSAGLPGLSRAYLVGVFFGVERYENPRQSWLQVVRRKEERADGECERERECE